MRALLRDRSYRRLLVGQTLSALGDYAMFLALAVWVKVLTGSSAKAGLAILPFILPSLVGPALGVFVDRFPRKRIMIITDLAAAIALLPLVLVRDASDIWLIYVVSFLLGLATVVYESARAGLLVSMLEEGDLGDANGLLQSTSQGMRLLAPLAGAALFAAFGGPAVALLDSGTFLV
jgi:MFS family permease